MEWPQGSIAANNCIHACLGDAITPSPSPSSRSNRIGRISMSSSAGVRRFDPNAWVVPVTWLMQERPGGAQETRPRPTVMCRGPDLRKCEWSYSDVAGRPAGHSDHTAASESESYRAITQEAWLQAESPGEYARARQTPTDGNVQRPRLGGASDLVDALGCCPPPGWCQ
jgi:hypothetical protein